MQSSTICRYVFSLSAALALVSGCGGSQPPIGVTPSNRAFAPAVHSNHPWLYAASNSNNRIDIYDVQRLKLKKIGQITVGIDQPEGISVDTKGALYVSEGIGRVEVYPAGSKSPALTLSQGLTSANDAVTDAAGNVYVANSGGSIADIVVYPAGQTVPSETITSDLFSRPYGEVFGASGDLYVADWNAGVFRIAAGTLVWPRFRGHLDRLQPSAEQKGYPWQSPVASSRASTSLRPYVA